MQKLIFISVHFTNSFRPRLFLLKSKPILCRYWWTCFKKFKM